jgi:hypothetical protein
MHAPTRARLNIRVATRATLRAAIYSHADARCLHCYLRNRAHAGETPSIDIQLEPWEEEEEDDVAHRGGA